MLAVQFFLLVNEQCKHKSLRSPRPRQWQWDRGKTQWVTILLCHSVPKDWQWGVARREIQNWNPNDRSCVIGQKSRRCKRKSAQICLWAPLWTLSRGPIAGTRLAAKKWFDDLKVIQISWWIWWMRAFDTQTVIEIWNTLKECKLELSIRLKYWLFTLYIRYILLIPSPTKEDCTRPKSQILTKFNPSINSGEGGSIALKQKTCKKFTCQVNIAILMYSIIFYQI